jgi:hypothetical protein
VSARGGIVASARTGIRAAVRTALVVGTTLGAWLAVAMTALAASPGPTAASGGDPRSSGQGPGLVGDPAFALLAVVAIGLGTVLATLIYVRLTARRGI